MSCRYCGSSLQPGALFCVECGRSVGDAEPSALRSLGRASVPPAPAPAPAPAPMPPPAVPAPVAAPADLATPHCPQCGTAVEPGDIFCGECGFVLQPYTVPITTPAGAAPPPDESHAEPVAEPVAEPFAEPFVEPFAIRPPDPADAVWAPAPPGTAAPAPAPGSLRSAPPVVLEDLEATRLVGAESSVERYVLQFSTGESVVVAGTGLIGRNPAPEPGEFVDELVPIFDVGKSVSKSHVEFGQEAGRFWISDRFSTNGTIVRQPDAAPVRCEPGKRYMIARGTRVDVGEQFFIVS